MTEHHRSKAVEALSASRRAASLRKQQAVLAAVRALEEQGSSISVAAVAREAGVTRGFIYAHEHLHVRVEQSMHARAQRGLHGQRRPRATSVADAGLRGELAQAHHVIKQLRAEVVTLRDQLEYKLGASLDAADAKQAEEALRAKTREVDRLVADNRHLSRQVAALERQIEDLSEDLAAERRAALRVATVTELPADPGT